jgi:uncharacterized membrane protein
LDENEPVICLVIESSFFLFLITALTTDNCLSHKDGVVIAIVLYFFFKPLEKIVTRPKLFLPALFFKKILKNFFTLVNFNKNVVFLNRCVDVVALCTLVKILTNKH